MSKKQISITSIILITTFACIIYACNKDEENNNPPETLCCLEGYTFYAGTTIPVAGVQLTVGSKNSTSTADGYFEINAIPVGNQVLSASKGGYDNLSANIELIADTNEFNVEMTSTTYTHKLYGTITSKSDGSGISDCRITVLNPDSTISQLTALTSSTGTYQIDAVPQGNRLICLSERCHAEIQVLIADSDYQYDAEFETKFTDNRDGKVYKVVEIDGKVWMGENLNFGERIDGVLDQEDNQIVEKYCYDDDESNCDKYGAFYQWNEMMQYNTAQGIQGICPDGWHLPTDDEYTDLVTYLGGDDAAGGKLKEAGTINWESPNHRATNESGFNALPSGCRRFNDGVFLSIGIYTSFWSSTDCDIYNTWYRFLYYENSTLNHFCRVKTMGRSVRCVKD